MQNFMKLVFFINYLNHHQLPVADELYRLLGDEFRFVATYPRNPDELKGGRDFSDRPYCILAAESEQNAEFAHELNRKAEACVFGAGNLDWELERAKTNKLSFEISERWFKRGAVNLLSPRLLKWWWLYQTRLRNKPFYKLCASAFTARDCNLMGTFKDRCFKWGYFTGLASIQKPNNNMAKIVWCGRLIDWKHPIDVILAANALRRNGYSFVLDIFGDGPEREHLDNLIQRYRLNDIVHLHGAIPNEQVHDEMAKSDIFLFTSDRKEGWGAVVNEAMSNGCCVVGSDAVGSVPYLISDKVNGMIYRSGNIESLVENIKYLLDNPEDMKRMGDQARRDLQNIWSPANAAQNLLTLISDLESGNHSSIPDGPCSSA